VFTVDLLVFPYRHCWLAGPLRPAAGFPSLHGGALRPRLLRDLRPARRQQWTTHLPVLVPAARDEGNTGQLLR